MSLSSYSPTDVEVLLAGFYKVTGFSKGSFISLKKDVNPFTTKRSSDGIAARTHINDDTFTLSLTLAQSSAANDIFTKLYEVDVATQSAKFPVFIKDNLGTTLFLSLSSWIEQVPDVILSDSLQNRTWVLKCVQNSFNVGGNHHKSSIAGEAVRIITGAIPGVSNIL